MAAICEKKKRGAWTFFKNWSVVEAFLTSGQDAKERKVDLDHVSKHRWDDYYHEDDI